MIASDHLVAIYVIAMTHSETQSPLQSLPAGSTEGCRTEFPRRRGDILPFLISRFDKGARLMKAKKPPAPIRRMGVETSEIRAHLIEAAAQIVKREGYAAVTAGRLAERFGLKRHIVHYYFRTIEDLLIAVMRRESERVRRLITKELESQEPLTMIWERCRAITATTSELLALAPHRKAIRIEIK